MGVALSGLWAPVKTEVTFIEEVWVPVGSISAALSRSSPRRDRWRSEWPIVSVT